MVCPACGQKLRRSPSGIQRIAGSEKTLTRDLLAERAETAGPRCPDEEEQERQWRRRVGAGGCSEGVWLGVGAPAVTVRHSGAAAVGAASFFEML